MKTLLKENRKALQFLHAAKGFDFEKDFFFRRIPGKFTYNTVTKAIAEEITGEYTAVILIKPNQNARFHNLYYAEMSGGRFQPGRVPGLAYWNYNIDYFFSVGDFEDLRKTKTEYVYIIAQKTEYLQPIKKKEVDVSQRFKLDKDKSRYRADGCNHVHDTKRGNYINKLYLITTDGSGARFEYEPYGSFYPNEKRSDIASYFIDNSGYLLRPVRMELKRRAIAIKAERDKAAAIAADFTKEESEINAKIKEIRESIARKAGAIEREADAKSIEKAAGTLARALWHYDYYKEKSAGKLFQSKEHKARTIQTIFEYLEKAKEATKQ